MKERVSDEAAKAAQMAIAKAQEHAAELIRTQPPSIMSGVPTATAGAMLAVALKKAQDNIHGTTLPQAQKLEDKLGLHSSYFYGTSNLTARQLDFAADSAINAARTSDKFTKEQQAVMEKAGLQIKTLVNESQGATGNRAKQLREAAMGTAIAVQQYAKLSAAKSENAAYFSDAIGSFREGKPEKALASVEQGFKAMEAVEQKAQQGAAIKNASELHNLAVKAKNDRIFQLQENRGISEAEARQDPSIKILDRVGKETEEYLAQLRSSKTYSPQQQEQHETRAVAWSLATVSAAGAIDSERLAEQAGASSIYSGYDKRSIVEDFRANANNFRDMATHALEDGKSLDRKKMVSNIEQNAVATFRERADIISNMEKIQDPALHESLRAITSTQRNAFLSMAFNKEFQRSVSESAELNYSRILTGFLSVSDPGTRLDIYKASVTSYSYAKELTTATGQRKDDLLVLHKNLNRDIELKINRDVKATEAYNSVKSAGQLGVSMLFPIAGLALAAGNIQEQYAETGTVRVSDALLFAAGAIPAAGLGGKLLKAGMKGAKYVAGAETAIGLAGFGYGTVLGVHDAYGAYKEGKGVDAIIGAFGTLLPVAHTGISTIKQRVVGARQRRMVSETVKPVEAKPTPISQVTTKLERPPLRPEEIAAREEMRARPERKTIITQVERKPAVKEEPAKAAKPTSGKTEFLGSKQKEVSSELKATLTPARQKAVEDFMSAYKSQRESTIKKFSELGKEEQMQMIRDLRVSGNNAPGAMLLEHSGLSNFAKTLGSPSEIESKLANSPIAKSLGIKNLESVYTSTGSPIAARSNLLLVLEDAGIMDFGLGAKRDANAARIKANTMASANQPLFSLMFSGNMLEGVQKNFSVSAGSKITGIKAHGGHAGGVYELMVQTPQGKTESFYAKRQDPTSIKNGANLVLEAGNPANIVSKPLEYIREDGTAGVYSIMEDIGNFKGKVRKAGREITVSETIFADRLGMAGMQGTEINKIYKEMPDIYWREIGRKQAASLQSGIWDRHTDNECLSGHIVSREDAKFLQGQGETIIKHEKGDLWVTTSSIDTDSGGHYLVQKSEKGYDTREMIGRAGRHDLALIFKEHAFENVKQKLKEQGISEEPTSEMVKQEATKLMEEARPHMLKGAEEWYRKVGLTETYAKNMREIFEGHDGQPVGIGKKLSESEKLELKKFGEVRDTRLPFNGKTDTPINFEDGRSALVAKDAIDVFNYLREYHSKKENLQNTVNTMLNKAQEAISGE
jgi:hypothetical protein